MTAHMTHTRQHAIKLPLHVRHADKIVKVTKHSRLWCEIVTCGATAYETRLILLAIASIVWVIVDVTLILLGHSEEL